MRLASFRCPWHIVVLSVIAFAWLPVAATIVVDSDFSVTWYQDCALAAVFGACAGVGLSVLRALFGREDPEDPESELDS
jgi:hypothetical protein